MYIAQYTNEGLAIFEKTTKKKDYAVTVTVGVSLIMSYNRVPAFNHYWSKNESLGNVSIKKGYIPRSLQASFLPR